MEFRSIKGTYDILPNDADRWQRVETHVRGFITRAGYSEIRTPAFEKTELFTLSVGEDSDVVSKEMYSWTDQGGTDLTLKPEYTASVMRSYIQHNLGAQSPLTKLYYLDNLFRRERPQKGRYRQFRQYGIEAIGSPHPEQDAEIIAIAYELLIELGIKDITLKLNSIGSPECRNEYRQALKDFLQPHLDKLSEISRKRFDSNPLRIFDTKIDFEIALLQDAPTITSFLTPDDANHFNEVQTYLEVLGVPFTLDTALVRGLDYYTRTTFEIISGNLGAQDALCGGGRYDKLVETLGGKPTPAVGFAAGLERILIAMNEVDIDQTIQADKIYLIGLGDAVRPTMLKILGEARKAGLNMEFDSLRRSVKSQMREANKIGASLAIILGDKELKDKSAQIKNLNNGQQESIPIDSIISYIQRLN
ncbi:MAG: histidine--tRNA ligase [Candidatus Neomarinimicrobiota bacterium]|nr:MAG: histidine--tRNA ligase [Candidatus Neomarinimicrobiota bacterium]